MPVITRAQTLKLADIKQTKPNRAVSGAHTQDLLGSLGLTGFATAIVVIAIMDEGEKKWQVIAGFHRWIAARDAGLTEIHAIVVENASALQLELIQLDENLLHRRLTVAQESRAFKRRKTIYQEINPETRRGGDRRSSKAQSGSLKNSFAKETSMATGRSITAVNRAVARGESIAENALEAVQGTLLETGQFLDRLAKVPVGQQEAYVTNALSKTSEEDGNHVDVEADLSRLRRCWSQSCAEARRKFLAEVGTNHSKRTTPGS